MESGEGERVTIEFVQIQGCAGSFRHGFAVPPSSRRKAILKAPSGRELPMESGEGERVTIEFVQIQGCAGSFRHGFAVPPSSRRKAMLPPDNTFL